MIVENGLSNTVSIDQVIPLRRDANKGSAKIARSNIKRSLDVDNTLTTTVPRVPCNLRSNAKIPSQQNALSTASFHTRQHRKDDITKSAGTGLVQRWQPGTAATHTDALHKPLLEVAPPKDGIALQRIPSYPVTRPEGRTPPI